MPLALRVAFALGLIATSGCENETDGPDDSFLTDGKADDQGVQEGSPEAHGVLAVANQESLSTLREDVGLSSRAAENIVSSRPFETLAELDAVPFVGPVAFSLLLDYARQNGYVVSARQARYSCRGVIRALFVGGEYVDFGTLFLKDASAEVELAPIDHESLAPMDFVFGGDGTDPFVIENTVVGSPSYRTTTFVSPGQEADTYEFQSVAQPSLDFPFDFNVGPIITVPRTGLMTSSITFGKAGLPPVVSATAAGNGKVEIVTVEPGFVLVQSSFMPFVLVLPAGPSTRVSSRFDLAGEHVDCTVELP
jgi:hypothetical protein